MTGRGAFIDPPHPARVTLIPVRQPFGPSAYVCPRIHCLSHLIPELLILVGRTSFSKSMGKGIEPISRLQAWPRDVHCAQHGTPRATSVSELAPQYPICLPCDVAPIEWQP